MKGCDACAIGGKGCDNPPYKKVVDGCGQVITYCKQKWNKQNVRSQND